jgi:hypothetical protein
VAFPDLTSVAEHWRRLARPSDASVTTRRFRVPGHDRATEEVPIEVLPEPLVRLLATPTMIDGWRLEMLFDAPITRSLKSWSGAATSVCCSSSVGRSPSFPKDWPKRWTISVGGLMGGKRRARYVRSLSRCLCPSALLRSKQRHWPSLTNTTGPGSSRTCTGRTAFRSTGGSAELPYCPPRSLAGSVLAGHHLPMSGFVLTPGSTGFLGRGTPAVDNKPLLSLIHETSRAAGFTVDGPTSNSGAGSFTAWRLNHPFEPSVTLVVHRVRPVFAVVEVAPDYLGLGSRVVDGQANELARAADLGWHRLSAGEAALSVSSSVLTELTEEERREIAYWKPETVGELVFNHWD